jgi:hypothetical protein
MDVFETDLNPSGTHPSLGRCKVEESVACHGLGRIGDRMRIKELIGIEPRAWSSLRHAPATTPVQSQKKANGNR